MDKLKKTLLVILLVNAVGCVGNTYYARIGAGKNSSPSYSLTKWNDQNETGCSIGFGLRHPLRWGLYGDLGGVHYSQCMAGKPYDKRDETASEHIYYNVEYRWSP